MLPETTFTVCLKHKSSLSLEYRGCRGGRWDEGTSEPWGTALLLGSAGTQSCLSASAGGLFVDGAPPCTCGTKASRGVGFIFGCWAMAVSGCLAFQCWGRPSLLGEDEVKLRELPKKNRNCQYSTLVNKQNPDQ